MKNFFIARTAHGGSFTFEEQTKEITMKSYVPSIIAIVAVACAALVMSSFVTPETPVAGKEEMIADWERAKAYTAEYLDAANDDVIPFKPTPDVRSFGQQMLHIAEGNYGFAATAGAKKSPIEFGALERASGDYTSIEDLKKVVMESYDFMIEALKDLPESRFDEPVKFFNRFEMTREVAFQKAFEHQTHHRGQTTVYLRLKGITPPNEKLF